VTGGYLVADRLDRETVESFGAQWRTFDQSGMPTAELEERFGEYFHLFPWDDLPADAEGCDLGCGTGRWATVVARRVARLHCIDPSAEALDVARRNLSALDNCEFHEAGIEELPLENGSMDFAYCLGVLHHLSSPERGLQACVDVLKPGGPMLVYVYYALEFRPRWYRAIFRGADLLRRAMYRLPERLKLAASGLIAVLVYWPLSRFARLAERLGADAANFPLYYYRRRSLYTLRTDARDRFGTPVEQRFTREELEPLMRKAGLERIKFSSLPPYWCAVGYRK
jgi:ubiquinone/menaquinone biosynthesis C-methylase UbiE